jgi:hypothetical protein
MGIGNTNALLPSWLMTVIIPVLQWIVLLASGTCFEPYILVQRTGSVWGGGTLSSLLAFIIGGGIGGGAGYGVSQSSYFRSIGGVGGISLSQAAPPTKSSGFSSSKDPNVGTCSAPNDQDQFVCEAYKNGELVTTTITESFIGK